jgi:hypothetical protein
VAITRGTAVDFGTELVRMYQSAQDSIMERMARVLATGIGDRSWGADKLVQIGDLRRFIESTMAGLSDPARRAASEAMLDAVLAGRRAALDEVRRQGVGGTLAVRLDEAQRALSRGAVDVQGQAARLAAALTDRLQGTHVPIVRQSLDVYREVIGRAAGPAVIGVETQQKAAQRAFTQLTQRGIAGFTDRGGRRWSLDSYVNMSTRTAMVQSSVEAHNDQLTGLGIDLVQVSDVAGECPLCRPWEGKILIVGGAATSTGPHDIQALHGIDDRYVTVSVAGTVAEARVAGLLHPNCRHSLGAYIPGVTRPLVSTEDPEGNAARAKQRQLELQTRRAKMDAATALTPAARRAAQARARASAAELSAHIEATGLTARRNASRVNSGLGPGPTPPPPVKPPTKPVQPPPPPPVRPRPPSGPTGDRRALNGLAPVNPTPTQRAAAFSRWRQIGTEATPTAANPKDAAHQQFVIDHNQRERNASRVRQAQLEARIAAGGLSPTQAATLRDAIADEQREQAARTRHISEAQARLASPTPGHLPPYDAGNPLSMYGGRLHITGGVDEHTYDNMAEVESYVGPSQHTAVRNYMAASANGGLYYGMAPLPNHDSLSRFHGGTTGDGRSWELVGGVYTSQERACVSSSFPAAVAASQDHVGMHEFGHALDSALGSMEGRNFLSEGGQFKTTMDQLERQYGSLILPYFRPSATTSNGYAESFANSYMAYRLHRGSYSGDDLAQRVGESLAGYTGAYRSGGATRGTMIAMGRALIAEMERLGLNDG